MNAGGVPNTCKSNEVPLMKVRWSRGIPSGGRVSNAWVTCLLEVNNREKSLLIHHMLTVSHDTVRKEFRQKMDPRLISQLAG